MVVCAGTSLHQFFLLFFCLFGSCEAQYHYFIPSPSSPQLYTPYLLLLIEFLFHVGELSSGINWF